MGSHCGVDFEGQAMGHVCTGTPVRANRAKFEFLLLAWRLICDKTLGILLKVFEPKVLTCKQDENNLRYRVIVKTTRYRLNVCVPSKFTGPNPDSQCDTIKRWSLWKVLDHENDVFMDESWVSLSLCSLLYEATREYGHLQTREQAVIRHWICQLPDLGLLCLHSCEK